MFAQVVAQLAEQAGVLGEAFHQDLASAIEHRLGVGKAGINVQIAGSLGGRVQRRVGEQRVGQRLDAGFAGDLGLGAAPGFVGQIQVFEALLGFGGLDLGLQRGLQLALFGDAGEDRGAAVLEFAQIAQALFQVAQLGVVQPAGDFLAVAGDEGHRGAVIEQCDGGKDLAGLDAEFGGDAVFDRREHSVGSQNATTGRKGRSSGWGRADQAAGRVWPVSRS